MSRRFVSTAIMLMLCTCIQSAFALGIVVIVTKETQAKLGLDYKLVAERVDAEAVLVRMEIPRTGKLKDITGVRMRIGPGRPIVAATLQTTTSKDGVWVVSFQLSPALAEKCSIDLVGPMKDRSYGVYSIELKGYVTARN